MQEARVFITGVNEVISFRGTLNHGIQPSTFVAEIIPQQINEANVEIDIKYPHPANGVELKECLIDSSSYSASRSGLVSTLYIKDFRWKWAYKQITLLANIRRGDGEIIIDPQYKYHAKKMTVSDILDEIEKALGARIIRKATFPADYYPEIIWDSYNAATALSDLLSPLAIRIVPSFEPNIVSIHNAGVGGNLPTDDLESLGTDTNPRERPKRIRVVSAPVLRTVDIGLYPVIQTSSGFEEADNSIYKPTMGRWGSAIDVSDEVATYPNETGRDLTTQECEFVESSAFQWFTVVPSEIPPRENSSGDMLERQKNIVGYGSMPGGTQLLTRYDILRGLQNFICEKSVLKGPEQTGDITYSISARRPFVYGAFLHEQETDVDARAGLTANDNSADDFKDIGQTVKNQLSYVESDTNEENRTTNDTLRKYIVPVPFSIDFDSGLVVFSRKVYLNRDGDNYFPELCLRAAVKTVNASGTFNRLEHIINVDPKSPADEIYIELNDVVPMWEYADGFGNRALDYQQQLKDYAEQILKTLSTPDEAATATYAGIKAIDLDGAIQSVSWSVGSSGARTTATRNQDTGDSTTISFRARQQSIEMGKSMRDAEIQRNADRRKAMGLPPL